MASVFKINVDLDGPLFSLFKFYLSLLPVKTGCGITMTLAMAPGSGRIVKLNAHYSQNYPTKCFALKSSKISILLMIRSFSGVSMRMA